MSLVLQVKDLVSSGQLTFVNGGWVQHDEATSHFSMMIDQTTRGHDFLLREFNFTPSIAWQIDPFGHSSTQVCMLVLNYKGWEQPPGTTTPRTPSCTPPILRLIMANYVGMLRTCFVLQTFALYT